MLKRWLIVWLLVSPLLVNAQNFTRGLLWEITTSSGQQSYLLGTMHSDDERITNLPPVIRNAFDIADSFTGEVMMDMDTIMIMSQSMYFDDGRQLKDIIGEQRYRLSAEYLQQYDMPEEIVSIMKPWAVATTLSLPIPETGQFLDMMLFNQAVASGKAVYGLESGQEQMSVLDSMSMEEQIAMLDEALENFHRLPAIMERFMSVYLARDLKGLQVLNDELMSGSDQGVAEHFENQLVVKRNHLMAERMLPRLQEGNAFIAIGALHLPGEEGVLNLLVKKGYRVKAVY